MVEVIVLAMLITMLVFLVLAGIAIGVGVWALARRSRLAPDLETGAPVSWLWSPTQPARLHRRLQRAVGPVHEPTTRARRSTQTASNVPLGSAASLDDVCRAITGQAIAVDRDVVATTRLPRRARRARLRLLQTEVVELERLTVRVHQQRQHNAQPAHLAGDDPPSRGASRQQLDGRLDALADAHAEVLAIEQSNGLGDPARLMAGHPDTSTAPRTPAAAPRPSGPAHRTGPPPVSQPPSRPSARPSPS